MLSTRYRRLGTEFLWISLGQAIAVLGAIFGVRILTGVLAPDVYGQLALGMTVATFVNVVVLGPLSNGATRFYALAREVGGLPGYFAAVKRLLLQASDSVPKAQRQTSADSYCYSLQSFAVSISLVLESRCNYISEMKYEK